MTDSLAPSTAGIEPPTTFDAVLYPNRSLPQTGFAVLMLAVAVVSMLVGAGFFMIGAWPVTGFLGLDVLLLYFAFRWSYRESRRAETITLDADGLTVRRIDPRGHRAEWHFEPYWTRVEVEQSSARRLIIRSHGQTLVIGAFITPAERLEVAEALNRALRSRRLPSGCRA